MSGNVATRRSQRAWSTDISGPDLRHLRLLQRYHEERDRSGVSWSSCSIETQKKVFCEEVWCRSHSVRLGRIVIPEFEVRL